jgi:hypothetical protein
MTPKKFKEISGYVGFVMLLLLLISYISRSTVLLVVIVVIIVITAITMTILNGLFWRCPSCDKALPTGRSLPANLRHCPYCGAQIDL